MWYLFFFLCLLFASIYQLRTKKEFNKLYYALWLLLTVMLCFRYAQGTDYLTYEFRYYQGDHGMFERGYQLLAQIFRLAHMDFSIFVMCIGLINMVCLNRFIKRYSSCTILSLLIAYPTLYLTYFFSALRQGIAISLFLGLMLECLEKKKYIFYYLLAFVAISFHKTSAIFLVVPIGIKFKEKSYYYILALAGIFAAASRGPWFQKLCIFLFGKQGAAYTKHTSFFIWGTLERCVLFALIYFLYHVTNSKEKENNFQDLLYKVYFMGFIGNIAFSQYFGSRLFGGFKFVEVVLLANLIINIGFRLLKQGVMMFMSAYLALMVFKNITTYIDQGRYGDISPFEYPYISILNKERSLERAGYREQVGVEQAFNLEVYWALPGREWDWFIRYEND